MKFFKNKKGQGLIEMTVAIGIIITGVVGALGLAVSALSSSEESRTRVIAANLAREGIEVVRKIRDSNWLAGCPDISIPAEEYNWQDGGCYTWDFGLIGPANDYTAIAAFDSFSQKWTLSFMPDDIEDPQTQFYFEENTYFQSNLELAEEKVPFFRLLTLNPICSDEDANEEVVENGNPCPIDKERVGFFVISELKWFERNREHTLKAEDKIYNWR